MRPVQLLLTILLVVTIIVFTCLTIQQSQYEPTSKIVYQEWSEINFNALTNWASFGTNHILKSQWQLVGSDPKTYKGPIVRGWPPGKSRNMSQIMVKNYVIDHCSQRDLSGIKLFIGVKTVSSRFEARDTTRETWASFQYNRPDIKVMFFSGEAEDSQTMNTLKMEIQTHCDLVIVHGTDTYENVTMKTVSILKYIHDHQLGLNPEISMIMDDDAYLNLDRLYYLVSNRFLARPMDFALTGFVFGGTLMKPDTDSKEEFTAHSVCPTYMFNGTRFPSFLSGSGYILPRAVIPCLHLQAFRLPFLHIDDVFLTGFCAEACGFLRVTHSQFSPGHKKLEEITCHRILLHYQDPNERLLIFDKLSRECANHSHE